MKKKSKIGRPVINLLSSRCHPDVPGYAKGVCKSCYNRQYRKKNFSKLKTQNEKWLIENRDRANKVRADWAANNPEKVLKTKRKYRSKNPGLWAKYCADRKARLLKRTPKWADLEGIKFFYAMCPKGMEVDHVIPLAGKEVSGLHVLENLQYLQKSENRSKYNRFYQEKII
jgi:hypothetical protein